MRESIANQNATGTKMVTRVSTKTERAADPQPEPENSYLKVLGERVREARARRGMTRKILSRDSGVSERYLAELESGRGNVSITRLRAVARAMGVALAELVREGPEHPVELTLLIERLGRLGPAELGAAARLVSESFGGDGGRQGRVALVGLRGAGKSTLGRGLAERLALPFVEMAKEIEREAGMSLAEIFDLWGQPAYRRHERRCLERLIESHPRAVITTGGSLVSEPGTYEMLLGSCYTVWLKAAPEEHMARVVAQGDHRPMAGNRDEAMADLERILAGREALYARADAVLDTSGRAVEACLEELVSLSQAAGVGA